MSCPSWQWHRTGSCWSPVRTLPVAPLWCDLGFVPNSRGNKAAVNLHPILPKMSWITLEQAKFIPFGKGACPPFWAKEGWGVWGETFPQISSMAAWHRLAIWPIGMQNAVLFFSASSALGILLNSVLTSNSRLQLQPCWSLERQQPKFSSQTVSNSETSFISETHRAAWHPNNDITRWIKGFRWGNQRLIKNLWPYTTEKRIFRLKRS